MTIAPTFSTLTARILVGWICVVGVAGCVAEIETKGSGGSGGSGGNGGGGAGGVPGPMCTSTPRVIVSHVDHATTLAVTHESIFWSSSPFAPGSQGPLIGRAPVAGGPASTLVASLPDGSTQLTGNLTVADGQVFFGASALMSVPQSGGDVSTFASGRVGATTADSARLYWSDQEAKEIRSEPLAGGSPMTLASVVGIETDSSANPREIVRSASRIYWTEHHANIAPNAIKSWAEIHQVPEAGGTPSFVWKEGGVSKLTANDVNLYWLGSGIESMAVAGGAVTVLRADGRVSSMVADASGLYVVAYGEYTGQPTGPDWATWYVLEYPISGEMKILASGMAQGNDYPGIAVDADCVYWSEATSDGSISTIAK